MDNIIWNVQIMPVENFETKYTILNPVPYYYLVYMECKSWDEAIQLRNKITEEIQK